MSISNLLHSLAKSIWSDKAPFWLSIVFAAWAWTATSLVSIVNRAPMVEYKIETENITELSGFNRRAYVQFNNLSASESYDKFVIVIRRKNDNQTIEFPQRAFKGAAEVSLSSGKLFNELSFVHSPDAVQIELSPFPPNATLHVAVLFKGSGEPGVVAASETGKTVNVTKASPATFFAKYEAWILFISSLFFTLLMLGLAVLSKLDDPKKIPNT